MKNNIDNCKKVKKIFIIACGVIIAVMIILTIIFIIMNQKNNYNGNTSPNEEVDFSGPAYKPSKIFDENNNEVSLENFSDKPIAIAFFNTTNQESLELLKILKEYDETYADKVNIVGICVLDGISETPDSVKAILEQNDLKIKNVLFDSDYFAKNEYDVNVIPTMIFINKKNEVVNKIYKEKITEDSVNANFDILAENY